MDRPYLDAEHVAFAADGRGLIVGVVDDDGRPHATRGWGLHMAEGHAVVVLDADETYALACLAPGRRIAVSAADVASFRSIQLKGVVDRVGPASDEDLAAADHYRQLFYNAIVEVDGVPLALVERVTPSRYAACHFEIHEIFDQTPGPGAGEPVPAVP